MLNGRSGQSISAATRQRVLTAAAKLGYAPSTAARTLRRGQSDLVLMLLPPEPLVRSLAPAALILTTPLPDDELSALLSLEVPLAFLQQEMDGPLGPDLGIGALQVEHLAAAGHTRLGVAVPDSAGYDWRVQVRLAAIEHACARHGLHPPAVERISLEATDAAAASGAGRRGPNR